MEKIKQENQQIAAKSETFGIILPIVLVSYFLILLNNSLVFTNTVQIRRGLGMSSSEISWVSNAHALTFGVNYAGCQSQYFTQRSWIAITIKWFIRSKAVAWISYGFLWICVMVKETK